MTSCVSVDNVYNYPWHTFKKPVQKMWLLNSMHQAAAFPVAELTDLGRSEAVIYTHHHHLLSLGTKTNTCLPFSRDIKLELTKALKKGCVAHIQDCILYNKQATLNQPQWSSILWPYTWHSCMLLPEMLYSRMDFWLEAIQNHLFEVLVIVFGYLSDLSLAVSGVFLCQDRGFCKCKM